MNVEQVIEECRACLRKLGDEKRYQLFQPWPAPLPSSGTLIANDLAALANIQILETDNHPKAICVDCYKQLKDTCSFIATVRKTDNQLKQVSLDTINTYNTLWPQPIDINQQISGTIENNVEVEVKQEVLSEDENMDYVDTWEPKLDIKIEPEEITAPAQLTDVDCGFELDEGKEREQVCVNGAHNQCEEEYLDNTIKQEPGSSDEARNTDPEYSLECILCMKQFNSVTSLKGHVISQHSYKTVKRKYKNEPAPAKPVELHPCVTCRRSFKTRTDLMVHESNHETHTCYMCRENFETSTQLSRHKCHQYLPRIRKSLRTYSKSNRQSQASIKKSKRIRSKLYKESNEITTELETNSSVLDSTKKIVDRKYNNVAKNNPTLEVSVEILNNLTESKEETRNIEKNLEILEESELQNPYEQRHLKACTRDKDKYSKIKKNMEISDKTESNNQKQLLELETEDLDKDTQMEINMETIDESELHNFNDRILLEDESVEMDKNLEMVENKIQDALLQYSSNKIDTNSNFEEEIEMIKLNNSIKKDKHKRTIEDSKEGINQNMEVHLAINPIKEESEILDDNLLNTDDETSNSYEPKIVSVSGLIE